MSNRIVGEEDITGRERDDFEKDVCQYQDRKISLDELSKRAYPTIRRFAQIAARNLGIEDEAEDVVQTLWVMFVTRIAQEYDRSKSIYPLLTTYARNLARNAKWQRQTTPTLEENDGESYENHAEDRLGTLWGIPVDEVESLVSRRLALEKVSAIINRARSNPAPHHGLMPGVSLVSKQEFYPKNDAPSKTKEKRHRYLSPEQRELAEIRRALFMTQAEFAEALNINVPRLSSWEYGRTKSVPAYYMEKARELLALGNRPRQQGHDLFANRAMSDILAEWAKDLNVDLDDTATLAGLLGVSEPTIRRWKENQVKPSITSLVRHHAIVQQLKKRLGS